MNYLDKYWLLLLDCHFASHTDGIVNCESVIAVYSDAGDPIALPFSHNSIT